MVEAIGTAGRLVAAAQDELIAGQGHIEMQAVAKRAQVSVGLAYHHFGSKAGLIAAVVEAFYRQLEETVFSAPNWPAATWVEREKGRVAAYIAFHYDHPFAPLVVGALSRADEVLDVEMAFTNRQLSAGAKMLVAAQRQGLLAESIDPELTIAMMIGGIRQAVLFAMMQTPRPQQRQLTDDIWSFMIAALQPNATPSH